MSLLWDNCITTFILTWGFHYVQVKETHRNKMPFILQIEKCPTKYTEIYVFCFPLLHFSSFQRFLKWKTNRPVIDLAQLERKMNLPTNIISRFCFWANKKCEWHNDKHNHRQHHANSLCACVSSSLKICPWPSFPHLFLVMKFDWNHPFILWILCLV